MNTNLKKRSKRGRMGVLVVLICLSFDSMAQEQALQEKVAGANDSVVAGFTEHVPATEIDFDMVLIPQGSFLMGSPENETGRTPDEGPQKEVVLDSFYMGKEHSMIISNNSTSHFDAYFFEILYRNLISMLQNTHLLQK